MKMWLAVVKATNDDLIVSNRFHFIIYCWPCVLGIVVISFSPYSDKILFTEGEKQDASPEYRGTSSNITRLEYIFYWYGKNILSC